MKKVDIYRIEYSDYDAYSPHWFQGPVTKQWSKICDECVVEAAESMLKNSDLKSKYFSEYELVENTIPYIVKRGYKYLDLPKENIRDYNDRDNFYKGRIHKSDYGDVKDYNKVKLLPGFKADKKPIIKLFKRKQEWSDDYDRKLWWEDRIKKQGVDWDTYEKVDKVVLKVIRTMLYKKSLIRIIKCPICKKKTLKFSKFSSGFKSVKCRRGCVEWNELDKG